MFSQVFIFSQWGIFDPMSFLQMGISGTRSPVGVGLSRHGYVQGVSMSMSGVGMSKEGEGTHNTHWTRDLGYCGICQHVGSTHPTGILSCNRSSVAQHNEISKDSNGLVHIANLNL